MIEIKGTWRGEYADQYDEKVEFEIHLDQNNDGFKGKGYDLYDRKVKFKIAGFVEGNLISFTKEYDESIVSDEVGNVFVDMETHHPGVHYYGRFNSDKNKFEGTWEVQVDESNLGHDRSLIWFDYGVWWLQKKE